MDADQMDILNKVKSGEISAEEGARRLAQLTDAAEAPETHVEEPVGQPVDQPVIHEMSQVEFQEETLKHFKNWWLIPLWIGFGIFVFSAGLMSWGYSNRHFFWFFCSWLPLLLGLIVIVAAFWSRTARWLHVRVKESSEEGSKNISISFPIPVKLAGWGLRLAGPYIPEMKDKEWIDAALPLLETIGSSKEPMVVEVNDKDGEKVQVYLI